MAQFTPPQSSMSPLISQLIQDKLRQQQWERTQNASIQKEMRLQDAKQAAEERKWAYDLALKMSEAGLDPTPALSGNLTAGLMALRQSGALDQEKKVSEVLQPLADVGSNLPTYRPGVPDSPDVARQRTAFQGGILSRGLESQPAMLAQRGVQMGQGTAKRREEIASLGRQAAKEARAGVLTQREFDKEVFRTRRDMRRILASHGSIEEALGSEEFRDSLFLFRSAEDRAQKNRSGVGRTFTMNAETGEMTFEEGLSGTAGAHRDIRAINTLQGLENAVEDLNRVYTMMVSDPQSFGTVGGLRRQFFRVSGIAADIITADLVQANDIMTPEVARAVQKSQLDNSAIQTAEVMGERFAYLWVRAQRGNGRITNEQLNDAKKLFQLVGGWASSAENVNRIREFLRQMNRDARQTRQNLENELGLTIPNSSYEPLPELPEFEGPEEAPRSKTEKLRDSVE